MASCWTTKLPEWDIENIDDYYVYKLNFIAFHPRHSGTYARLSLSICRQRPKNTTKPTDEGMAELTHRTAQLSINNEPAAPDHVLVRQRPPLASSPCPSHHRDPPLAPQRPHPAHILGTKPNGAEIYMTILDRDRNNKEWRVGYYSYASARATIPEAEMALGVILRGLTETFDSQSCDRAFQMLQRIFDVMGLPLRTQTTMIDLARAKQLPQLPVLWRASLKWAAH
ncbi:hypothetical protein BDZ88DRAFT_450872 [Geranomyces variabilis]|nr:hypothetical protein BDZ88DRAFT_450872 [Geranomyces variabilis]KAJ3137161.1 hypothetical protein HDU90_002333 [Geranomyces variabilis]